MPQAQGAVGLVKGLGVTFKEMSSTMFPKRARSSRSRRPSKGAVTVQYPHEKEDPAPRARGVIALKEENCTVCMLCARELPRLVHLHRGPQGEGAAPPARRQAPHGQRPRPLRHRLRALHVLRHLRRGVPVRRPVLEPRVRVLRAPHRRPAPRQGRASASGWRPCPTSSPTRPAPRPRSGRCRAVMSVARAGERRRADERGRERRLRRSSPRS